MAYVGCDKIELNYIIWIVLKLWMMIPLELHLLGESYDDGNIDDCRKKLQTEICV